MKFTKGELAKMLAFFEQRCLPEEYQRVCSILNEYVETNFDIDTYTKKRSESSRRSVQKKCGTEGKTKYELYYKDRYTRLANLSGMSVYQVSLPGGVKRAEEIIKQKETVDTVGECV